jgi:putative sporulation protein YtaF
LLDSVTKSIIRKNAAINKEIKISFCNFKFILKLYADPEAADIDVSRSIEPREALLLAIPVSLDGFAVGFGAAFLGFNGGFVILFSILANGAALWLGSKSGDKISKQSTFNTAWLAGVILIGLAFAQLL